MKNNNNMIVVQNPECFYDLRDCQINRFVLNDDVFEFEFEGNRKLFVDMALMRIYTSDELLLSSWETSVGKDYQPISSNESLAKTEVLNVLNLLKGARVKNLVINEIGDLRIKMSNSIYIDIFINCFCVESYYYKLVCGAKESVVYFSTTQTINESIGNQ